VAQGAQQFFGKGAVFARLPVEGALPAVAG
jgi:hypothetical protein